MANALMIQGTMSNAGKSILTCGLCRVFARRGLRTAPFKSQNMALNSFITDDGLEMGRAQAVQAQAAGIRPDVRMNPILLKPTTDMASQVIVNGRVLETCSAMDYYARKASLLPAVRQAYDSLARDFDVIVIEGAGSPAEINLPKDDFVNMGMAKLAHAPVLLVGDIDRGGVFASLWGTVHLLEPEEQARIKGLIINKFRGDPALLAPGFAMLEEKTGKPVLGVVPMLPLDIDEEDSLASRLAPANAVNTVDCAVIRLPRISNFTDFSALSRFPFVSVRYVRSVAELGSPDLLFLPGTKNTMADLKWMRETGMEAAVRRLSSAGVPIVGICGGYQMLGRELRDPLGVEEGGSLSGMGLLDTVTTFSPQKTRTNVTGTVPQLSGFWAPLSGSVFSGYEIHMGQTQSQQPVFARLSRGTDDGAASGMVLGSYVHGLFDSGTLAQRLLSLIARQKGIGESASGVPSWYEYQQRQYDLLADALEEHLDLDRIFQILKAGEDA